jgi:hypothetical protein
MKKLFVFSIVLFALMFTCYASRAQESWELGVRIGDRGSVEASIPLGVAPRIKPAVFFYDRVGVAAYLDWMFSLNDGPSGLKFFPGVGPEMFFDGDFDFAVTGDFGVEYAFKFPITIGVDWRPAIFLTNSLGFEADHYGFSARYRFGEGVKFKKEN